MAGLADLARDEWFKDRSSSSLWLRIATIVLMKPADFATAINNASIKLHAGVPISLAFGTLDGAKLPTFSFVAHADESGQTIINTKVDERALPAAHYWFIATPHRIDGSPGKEGDARRLMARISALIVAHAGLNAMFDVVYEGEVDAHDSRWHQTSSILKNPNPVDGPFLHSGTWADLSDVAAAISAAPTERRHRIELALEFFERGVRAEEEFFNLWTALEILCNGTAQRIRTRIQKAYELDSVGDVDHQTGFAQIAAWRHNFFHKGERPTLSPDVARYMQWLFLDLLRLECSLGARGYVAQIQAAQGYDLSPLGLADRRTPEQLARRERAMEMLRGPRTSLATPNEELKPPAAPSSLVE